MLIGRLSSISGKARKHRIEGLGRHETDIGLGCSFNEDSRGVKAIDGSARRRFALREATPNQLQAAGVSWRDLTDTLAAVVKLDQKWDAMDADVPPACVKC
jgi:hypothetical protein